MDDAFIARFTIVGPPDVCTGRLQALARLGLDKIATSCAARGADAADAATARALFEREVLPAMRAAG